MKIRKVLKTFEDGREIGFGNGKIDSWCVYVKSGNKEMAPRDIKYFSNLLKYARKTSKDRVFSDMKRIFEMADYYPVQKDLDEISEIAKGYGVDSIDVDVDFTTIYLGMIAEQQKRNAILKKRIKMLGIYQTLFEEHLSGNVALTNEELANGIEKSAKRAAKLSDGVHHTILDGLCKERGF